MSRKSFVSLVVTPPIRHDDACVRVTFYGPEIGRGRSYLRRINAPSLHRLNAVIWERVGQRRARLDPSLLYAGWFANLREKGA
jgi:hypothetical protein